MCTGKFFDMELFMGVPHQFQFWIGIPMVIQGNRAFDTHPVLDGSDDNGRSSSSSSNSSSPMIFVIKVW